MLVDFLLGFYFCQLQYHTLKKLAVKMVTQYYTHVCFMIDGSEHKFTETKMAAGKFKASYLNMLRPNYNMVALKLHFIIKKSKKTSFNSVDHLSMDFEHFKKSDLCIMTCICH